jgi:hypothetical protein
MKDDEPSPTPEELREAEALARALDGAPSDAAPPPEALETAALLRHGGGELDPARAQALAAKLRAEVRPRPRRRLWPVLVPLALGVAVLVILPSALLLRSRQLPPSAVSPAGLPAPTAALLAAQAEAARGHEQALGALDAQMRSYRRALFARLQEGGR